MISTAIPRPTYLSAILSICISLLIISSPVVASADEPSEEEAQRLFLEGRESFEAGDYQEAAEIFLQVYDILDAPALLYNIGESYRRADKLVPAEEYLQEYLNKEPDAPNAEEVVERIIDIQQELVARQATLDVTTSPPGARIAINDDDETTCTSPCSIDLRPGHYEVRAELADHQSSFRTIDIEARQDTSVELTLEPESMTGFLLVTTDIEDAVLRAGGERHSLPLSAPIELDVGPQAISIDWDGDRIEYDVEIEFEEQLHLFVPLSNISSGQSSKWQSTAIGLGGASLALFAAAGATGMQVRSTHDRLQAQFDATGAVDAALVERGKRQQSLANGLWAGAAGTLLTSAGIFAWTKLRSRDTPEPDMEPTTEPTPSTSPAPDDPDRSDHESGDDDRGDDEAVDVDLF